MNVLKNILENNLEEFINDLIPNEIPETLRESIIDYIKIRKELSNESDRGVALLSISIIEKLLEDLLKKRLLNEKKIIKDLFDGFGPLSSLSGKTKIAYSIGLIDKTIYDELNLVRSIRNKFAHSPEIIKFSDEEIVQKCNNLKLVIKYKELNSREKFINSTSRLNTLITIEIEKIQKIEPKEFDHESLIKSHLKTLKKLGID
ncbi:MltR family transcriptional regulator [Tenacibaculum jejuense]|nr:MltR family transcriptional regulator [Tenacibaculum jejuense]